GTGTRSTSLTSTLWSSRTWIQSAQESSHQTATGLPAAAVAAASSRLSGQLAAAADEATTSERKNVTSSVFKVVTLHSWLEGTPQRHPEQGEVGPRRPAASRRAHPPASPDQGFRPAQPRVS